jgi:protein ImuB
MGDPAKILQIAAPVLESIRSPNGINLIKITAQNLESLKFKQPDFTLGGNQVLDLALQAEELLNNLSLRLGADQIKTAQLNSSYLPEKSFFFKSVKSKSTTSAEVPPFLFSGWPPRLLEKPEEIKTIALLPDHPPAKIIWAGKVLRIIRASGPERLAAEWWHEQLNGNLALREYFRVQDQYGQWLWVFRESLSAKWYVHGLW